MKKLTTIFLALCLSVTAQHPSGDVIIINVKPSAVCAGDSIQISFNYHPSAAPDSTIPYNFYFWDGQFTFVSIWNTPYTAFYGLSKYAVGSDTTYQFWYHIPLNYHPGQILVCVNSVTSCFNIMIFACENHVGLSEVKPDKIKPIYYDLHGNIMEPRKNEIMIEKVGEKRRKVIIQD